jgi:hypothetical protein
MTKAKKKMGATEYDNEILLRKFVNVYDEKNQIESQFWEQ